MTVNELINRLRRLPKDAQVFIVPDELEVDDDGYNIDLHRISEVVYQDTYVETNGDFIKITEVMVKFEENRAYFRAGEN